MYLFLAYFLAAAIALLLSTSVLVNSTVLLAKKLKMSPLIIGVTVIAIGTSLPELAVSTVAAVNQDYPLALGNIIGSNIINILLVFPLGVLFGNIRIGTTKTQRTGILLIFVTLAYFVLNKFIITPAVSGVILISLSVLVTYVQYRWGIEGGVNEDKALIDNQNSNTRDFTLVDLFKIVFSLVSITISGLVVVNSVEKLSELFGYSTGVLGLTLTAVSTSLPEILTTFFSQKIKDEKMVIGNILGSNIYNQLIIGGVSIFFITGTGLGVFSWLWLFIATSMFCSVIWVFRGRVVPKYMAIFYFFLCLVYLYTVSIKSMQ